MNTNNSVNSVLRIATLLLVLVWCFLIIKPFWIIAVWAIILAVALYPFYNWLVVKIGTERKKYGTLIYTLITVILMLIPTYFIVGSIFESINNVADQFSSNMLKIPSPNEKIKSWPLIGESLYKEWYMFSNNVENYFIAHRDQIMKYGGYLLSDVEGFLLTLVIFIISFFISITLMYNADIGYKASINLSQKLIGVQGKEVVLMSRDTIRSVVKGILLVAIIQAVLAFIGFEAIGLPFAGIFTFLVLVLATIQLPLVIIFIPAILIAFSNSEPVYAIIFTIYCLLLTLLNNVLTPIFFEKALKHP